MDNYENQQSKLAFDEDTQFSKHGHSSSSSSSNKSCDINCFAEVDHGKSLYMQNSGSVFHEHNTSIKIIEPHSEPEQNNKEFDFKFATPIKDSSKNTSIIIISSSPESPEATSSNCGAMNTDNNILQREPFNKALIESLPIQNIKDNEFNYTTPLKDSNPNTSIITIFSSPETPEVMSPNYGAIYTDNNILITNHQVEQVCVSPGTSESSDEVNNTLEHIEYMLRYKPKYKNDKKEQTPDKKNMELDLSEKQEFIGALFASPQKENTEKCDSYCAAHVMGSNQKVNSCSSPEAVSPDYDAVQIDDGILTVENQLEKLCVSPGNVEANKISNQNVITADPNLCTTSTQSKPGTNNIKTPTSASCSVKKRLAISEKKPLKKRNLYHNICSPVAAYIYNTPQTPLMKNVYPNKLLPSTSSISKEVKSPNKIKSSDKKNANLPFVVYKSAKKTKVIEIQDEYKLPPCQWVKQMTASMPTVVKHEYREFGEKKKPLVCQQDESYGNMSYVQADVSVCTQKTAVKLKKHE